MNEARMENVHDCDSCDRIDWETAREELCGGCQEVNAARLTRDYYLRKVVEHERTIKDLEKTCEFLRREVNRKSEQIEFLR